MSTDVPQVVPPEEMSDENLLRHINGRHGSCWGDNAPLLPFARPGAEFKLANRKHWELLHDRLHRDGDGDEPHVHE